MERERRLFQQSLIPQLTMRPSWRRAIGWGSFFADFTLSELSPGWKFGFLLVPACLLLAATKTRGPATPGTNADGSQPASRSEVI